MLLTLKYSLWRGGVKPQALTALCRVRTTPGRAFKAAGNSHSPKRGTHRRESRQTSRLPGRGAWEQRVTTWALILPPTRAHVELAGAEECKHPTSLSPSFSNCNELTWSLSSQHQQSSPRTSTLPESEVSLVGCQSFLWLVRGPGGCKGTRGGARPAADLAVLAFGNLGQVSLPLFFMLSWHSCLRVLLQWAFILFQ